MLYDRISGIDWSEIEMNRFKQRTKEKPRSSFIFLCQYHLPLFIFLVDYFFFFLKKEKFTLFIKNKKLSTLAFFVIATINDKTG